MPLVKCPECRHSQVVRSEMMGLHVRCKKCRKEFRAKESAPREPEAAPGAGLNPLHILAGVGLIACLLLLIGGGFVGFLLLRPARPAAPLVAAADPPSVFATDNPVPPPAVPADHTPGVPPPSAPQTPDLPEYRPSAKFGLPPVDATLDSRQSTSTPVVGRTDPLDVPEKPPVSKPAQDTAGTSGRRLDGDQKPPSAASLGFPEPARIEAGVTTHLKDLASKDPKARLAAATALGEARRSADLCAAPLCNATTDPVAAVSAVALRSLEKVRPDLYGPVSDLVLDATHEQRVAAVVKLGTLSERGAPANRLVLRFATAQFARADAPLARQSKSSRIEREREAARNAVEACIKTLRQTKAPDPEVGALLTQICLSPRWPAGDRERAIRTLGEWALGDPVRTRGAFVVFHATLPQAPLQLATIETIGTFRTDAKDFATALRNLKLSNTAAIRATAGRALDAVEGP